MAEITIDNTEAPPEGGFTAEEQEAIQVGEALQQEEQAKLAGKFEDAAQLEKAYLELQNKFSSGDREAPTEEEAVEEPEAKKEVEEEAEEIDGTILDTLWGQIEDGPTKETLEELSKFSSEDIAKMHVQYRLQQAQPKELSDDMIGQLQGSVGGGANYNKMMGWAKENLSETEVGMYDEIMGRGDPLACFFAVQALSGRMMNEAGFEGEMITGKAAPQQTNGFRSQAEVVKAMQDSRYDDDPAYRQDVFDKLERSNIQY